MLANIALALGLDYAASEEEIIAKANSLQREINTLRVHVKRPTKRAPDFAPESRSNCTFCGGLLPKHNLPCEKAQSQ